MFQKLKYHILIFLILGYLLYVPQYVRNTENFDLIYLFTNLFVTYLLYSSITILVGLITYLSSKNLEKSILITKSLIENGTGIPQLVINFTNLFQQLLWYSMGVRQSTGYTGLNKIISGNLIKYSRNFNQQEIEDTLLVLKKSDMLTKSTSLSPLALIEPVIVNICEGIYV